MVTQNFTDLAKKGFKKFKNSNTKDKKKYLVKYTMAGNVLTDLTKNNFLEFVANSNI